MTKASAVGATPPAYFDEDDSVSITSTAPSEVREEYPVERILHEEEQDGEKHYLIYWADYSIERATLERRENIDQVTIDEWNTTKMRIDRGLEKPFDIEAWKARQREIGRATENRRWRRREKRKRLGIEVSPSPSPQSEAEESSIIDFSSDEALEVADEVENNYGIRDPKVSENASKNQRGASPQRSRERAASEDEGAALSDDSLMAEIKEKERRKSMRRTQLGSGSSVLAKQKSRRPRELSSNEPPQVFK